MKSIYFSTILSVAIASPGYKVAQQAYGPPANLPVAPAANQPSIVTASIPTTTAPGEIVAPVVVVASTTTIPISTPLSTYSTANPLPQVTAGVIISSGASQNGFILGLLSLLAVAM